MSQSVQKPDIPLHNFEIDLFSDSTVGSVCKYARSLGIPFQTRLIVMGEVRLKPFRYHLPDRWVPPSPLALEFGQYTTSSYSRISESPHIFLHTLTESIESLPPSPIKYAFKSRIQIFSSCSFFIRFTFSFYTTFTCMVSTFIVLGDLDLVITAKN